MRFAAVAAIRTLAIELRPGIDPDDAVLGIETGDEHRATPLILRLQDHVPAPGAVTRHIGVVHEATHPIPDERGFVAPHVVEHESDALPIRTA